MLAEYGGLKSMILIRCKNLNGAENQRGFAPFSIKNNFTLEAAHENDVTWFVPGSHGGYGDP